MPFSRFFFGEIRFPYKNRLPEKVGALILTSQILEDQDKPGFLNGAERGTSSIQSMVTGARVTWPDESIGSPWLPAMRLIGFFGFQGVGGGGVRSQGTLQTFPSLEPFTAGVNCADV